MVLTRPVRDDVRPDSGVESLAGAVGDVVSIVEGVHRALVPWAHEAFAAPVYERVRAGVTLSGAALGTVARLVGVSAHTARLVDSGPVQRVVGVANGIFGEQAAARGGPVQAGMTVRLDHRRVEVDRASLAGAYPSASGRVVVFVHGLVETERSWFSRAGTDFGSRLADDLGCTPVYVRYNTGRRVVDNGGELADLLGALVRAWPVPVTEIILVGHSMGGLVARSAVLRAEQDAVPWLSAVTRVVCLGTPHTGSPLERGAVRLAGVFGRFPITAPLVRLLAMRSEGIQDLAEGAVSGEPDASGLPPGVRQCFVAVTLSRAEGSLLGRLVGDLLVAPASAGDRDQNADVVWLGGLHHFDLLRHDLVYDAVLGWLLQCEQLAACS
jgi:pimeloyl-ACP methyl ester carboxylesterase